MKIYKEHKLAFYLCILSCLVYSFLIIHKYMHFAYNDWDTAFFNQSLWNLLHGRLYSELYGVNTWGTHLEFIFDFTAPFLLIFPHPLTFTFVQIVFYILSGWLFYLMAQEDIGKTLALFMTFMYLFFTPNLLAMCHDHNAESLSPFFIMLAVYLFRKGRVGWYYLGLILLLFVKENMTFVVAMLGVWGLFARDRNRFIWGILPLLISLLYFIFAYSWFIPFFRGVPYTVWARYAYLGNDKREIFMHLLNFRNWIVIISDAENLTWISSLFSVFFLPAILSPFILLLMMPIFVYHLLSSYGPEKSLFNIYALSMTPMIFLATVNTLKKYGPQGAFLLCVCLFFILGCCVQMYQFSFPLAIKTGFVHENNDAEKWRMVKSIPKDAPVIATFEFLPALSLRKDLYSFHKVYSREYHEEAEIKQSMFAVGKPPFRVPECVGYALINYNDLWLQNMRKTDAQYIDQKIGDFLKDWQEIDSSGTSKLYKRRVSGRLASCP